MSRRDRHHPPDDREIGKVHERAAAKLAELYPGAHLQSVPVTYQDVVRQEPVAFTYELGTIVITHGGRLIAYQVLWDARMKRGKLAIDPPE